MLIHLQVKRSWVSTCAEILYSLHIFPSSEGLECVVGRSIDTFPVYNAGCTHSRGTHCHNAMLAYVWTFPACKNKTTCSKLVKLLFSWNSWAHFTCGAHPSFFSPLLSLLCYMLADICWLWLANMTHDIPVTTLTETKRSYLLLEITKLLMG